MSLFSAAEIRRSSIGGDRERGRKEEGRGKQERRLLHEGGEDFPDWFGSSVVTRPANALGTWHSLQRQRSLWSGGMPVGREREREDFPPVYFIWPDYFIAKACTYVRKYVNRERRGGDD